MNQRWKRALPTSLWKKLTGGATAEPVVSNTGWQFADHLLRMGVGLLVGIWVVLVKVVFPKIGIHG